MIFSFANLKEKVQDCKSRIKKCAECEKEQLELTKYHHSLLMNLTVQCNIDKAEIYSLKAKIEEKEKYALAKVNEFDKFWKERQEREDGFIKQLDNVKENLPNVNKREIQIMKSILNVLDLMKMVFLGFFHKN